MRTSEEQASFKVDKSSNNCRTKCGGPCEVPVRIDCSPECGGFCLNGAEAPEVPHQVRKNWEDLYDKVMKDGDVGCQPYFAPATDLVETAWITDRLYRKQTIYQDKVQNALKRQIRARHEDDDLKDKEEDDFIDTTKALNQMDIDLMRILSAPPIDVAYRNYMARTKESLEEEAKEENPQAMNIPVAIKEEKPPKKVLTDPAEKKAEFILLSKMVTNYDEEIAQDVEQLWAALGPMMIEMDAAEKRKALKRVSKELKKSKGIQQVERSRILHENRGELTDFLKEKSTEMDHKFSNMLTLLKVSMENARTHVIEILLKSCEELNNYEIEWDKMESVEKFQESIRVFTHYCNVWMRIMESVESKKRLNTRQLIEKDYNLILDVQKMEEHRIMKSLTMLDQEHELIEGTLADYLYARDKTINRLQTLIEDQHKKVDIWKGLVEDLMTQFQKFVTFALGEQPMLTQYLLSIDAMYHHFLNDSLEKEREKKAEEDKKEVEVQIRKHYPALGLGRRLSRGSTTTTQTTTVTEPEIPKYEIPDTLMADIAVGEVPQHLKYQDELEHQRDLEVEAVVQTFGYEATNDNEKGTSQKRRITKASSRSETSQGVSEDVRASITKEIVDEECADMDETTRTKIDTVLKLMHEKREFMKGFMNL